MDAEASMKKLKIALGVLALLLIVVVAVGMIFLGSIVKTAVVKGGPLVMGVPITLEKATVRPWNGHATLRELVVGNPEGFKTPFLFRMGELTAELDLRSLATDTLVIRKIHILGPEITYEASLKTSNIGQLLKNLEGENEAPETPSPEEPKASGSGKAEKKVVIEDFLLEGAKVHLSATLAGGKSLTVPLPTLHLTDLGKKSGGATATEVIREVCSAVFQSIGQAAAGAGALLAEGAQELGRAAEETLKKGAELTRETVQKGTEVVGEVAAEAAEKAGEAVQKVGGVMTEGAKKALGSVTGLLKHEKKEQPEPELTP